MGSQVAATAGLLYDVPPTFTNFVVDSWEPEEAGETKEHMNAKGDTYAHDEVNPGQKVNAVLAVKSGQAVPANLTVLTGTYPDASTKKFVITGIQPFRDGALTKFRCLATYRASMPNPA